MNEVKKCSISGLSFTLTGEAYKMLSDYLDALAKAYGKEPDGDEIIDDIEARIAELILSRQENTLVADAPLIADIIARLGSAEDISGESSADDARRNEEPKYNEPRIPRRLYRDLSNARIGGVCAGIARFFNLDPSIIRLAALSPLLLIAISILPFTGSWLDDMGGSLMCTVAIAYAVMWLAVPAAKTPRQKLEMNGERITIHSIRDNAGGMDADTKARQSVAGIITSLGRALIIIIKIIGVCAVISLSAVFLGLIVAFAVICFGINTGTNAMTPLETTAMGLAFSLCMIPIASILYVLICLIAGKKSNLKVLLVMFILWIINFIALPVVFVRIPQHRHHHYLKTGTELLYHYNDECDDCDDNDECDESDESEECDESDESDDLNGDAVSADRTDTATEDNGEAPERPAAPTTVKRQQTS